MTTRKLILVIFSIACLIALPYAQEVDDTYSQLCDFIQENADNIKNGNDVNVYDCLDQFTAHSFEDYFGPLMRVLKEASCLNGVQNCNLNKLSALFSQLKANGVDEDTVKKTGIVIGSIIGTLAGDVTCGGSDACEWLGARIGTTLTCLSVPEDVYAKIVDAMFALEDIADQVGDIVQDALDTITNTANQIANEIQNTIDQVLQGLEDEALSALKSVTDSIDQGVVDMINSVNSIIDAGQDILDAGQDVIDAVDNAGQQVSDAGQDAIDAVGNAGDGLVDLGDMAVDSLSNKGIAGIPDATLAGLQAIDLVKGAGQDIVDAGQQTVDAVVDAGQQVVDAGQQVVDAGQQISDATGGVAQPVVDVGQQVVDQGQQVVDQVQDAGQDVVDAGQGVVDAVGSLFRRV